MSDFPGSINIRRAGASSGDRKKVGTEVDIAVGANVGAGFGSEVDDWVLINRIEADAAERILGG